MSEHDTVREHGSMEPVRRRVKTRIESLRRTKWQYDLSDKVLIGASIVLGASTTIAAAANQQLWAVALSALVTGTVSAQHWFALGPRARNADLARVRLEKLEVEIEMHQVDPTKAAEALARIEADFVEHKAPIGSQTN